MLIFFLHFCHTQRQTIQISIEVSSIYLFSVSYQYLIAYGLMNYGLKSYGLAGNIKTWIEHDLSMV